MHPRTMLVLTLVLAAAPVARAETAAAPAAAECYTRQDLSARAPGFVARVLARDGQTVGKGDVLAELDNRQLKTAVREAKAGVAVARATLSLAEDAHKRLKQMATSDTVSPQELFQASMQAEQARAGLQSAEAVHDRVRIQYEDTFIKAEIDGRVSGLPQVKNLFVQAGQSLGRVEATASACAARAK